MSYTLEAEPTPATPPAAEPPVQEAVSGWLTANWKWLAALGIVGSAVYYFTKRKTALSGLGDYCVEFLRPDQFEPSEGTWTRGRCYADKGDAEAHVNNLRSGGHSARVVEK